MQAKVHYLSFDKMLLRSSSTPHAGTHHSFFSDSPNRDADPINKKCTKPKHPPFYFSHGVHHHLNLTSFSTHSSPVSRPASGSSVFRRESKSFRLKAFRRAWSDGNLEDLACISCDIDEFCDSDTPTKSLYNHNNSMLQTAPSLSIYNSVDEFQDEEQGVSVEALERTVTIGDCIEGGGEFCFGEKSMGLIEEVEEEEEVEGLKGIQIQNLRAEIEEKEAEVNEPPSPPMYLATAFGRDTSCVGGDGFDMFDLPPVNFDDSGDSEEYYQRMVDEYPCHPLFLRNYAQLLLLKGDIDGAEEYYSRATLADPKDGEILLQYAKLVWEHHHDQDRASIYFERAAQASPQDSHVLAAYASFLWEIDEMEEDGLHEDHIQIEGEECMKELEISTSKEEVELVSPSLHLAAGLGIDAADFTAADSSKGGNVEDCYKKMVEENPNNPLYLRNYAQFLCQSKGDLQGAEEFYSRAILADPREGEIISQYAKLVWELHHDRDKALCYFERAVQATPADSHVLAAYASFLWETEEEEEDDARQDCIQMPVLHGQALSIANAQL